MPGDDLTHGPPATKKQAAVTTGSAGSTGIPRAMVLRLISRSPRGPGSFAPVIPEKRASQELSASVGAPGPHGLAVRARVSRLLPHPRPPHPASTFVTTRTPLFDEAGQLDEATDLG